MGSRGDVPHTVSTWINASNLEANALTQQLFSIGSGYDKAFLKVDDTQIAANTWHNVTYAYQGEGGSKVTYVDGRKVEEAQVEDTFGEYPPFAMTDYETGGYRVSQSNPDGGSEFVWKYYDNDNSTFKTFGDYYNGGSYNRSPPTNHGGNVLSGDAVPDGEWHKIEMPHRLKLGSLGIRPRDSGNAGEPVNWSLYGSNDDVNWTMLYKKTDSTVPDDALETQYPVNATSGFSYFLIVMTKSAGYLYLNVSEFNWYGHKEGDLTRFPEPTRVLKYPHIAMTGPGQRGYVASASSTWPLESIQPEQGFDGVLTSGGLTHVWESGPLGNSTTTGPGRYTAGSTFNTAYLSNTPLYGEGVFQTAESSNTWTGEWLQIQLPHSINTTKCVFGNAVGNSGWNDRIPTSGVILGSINGSTWNLVHQFSSTLIDQTLTISHTGYYKYFRLVGTTVGGSATIMLIPEWELYGTQEDTETPMIVGGPFAGKVANFRVYDQYLGDERIQEIYDAQKDEFGHKKSSMTFYKGRIGVGTTEPEGALTVLDEPHALQKFPARAISANDSYVEGGRSNQVKCRGGGRGTGHSMVSLQLGGVQHPPEIPTFPKKLISGRGSRFKPPNP